MDDNTENEIPQKFAGIHMSDLISGPLTAVAESQLKLSEASYEYMMKIGIDESENARLVESDLDHPAESAGEFQSVNPNV